MLRRSKAAAPLTSSPGRLLDFCTCSHYLLAGPDNDVKFIASASLSRFVHIIPKQQ